MSGIQTRSDPFELRRKRKERKKKGKTESKITSRDQAQAAIAREAKTIRAQDAAALSRSLLLDPPFPFPALAPPGLGFHGSRHRPGVRRRGRIPGVRRLCHLHALLVRRRRRRLRVSGGRAGAGAAALGVGGGAAAQVLLRLFQRRHRRHPSLRPLPG